ncbi:uncharacterized protein LACBIDRAFT_302259 [Laccaria bicolor S238N-H82]|uniref:Signal peptidase complex subunit 1 n=1 Tax=Laccaria bicolor (strain S238N-H82 / ATCC MYA-4686) TaxID=486041 RepID=B0DHE8_LACBS|nr:uncharacterized protein LACBIDRAFT_302259 [Laccaria bicolor S238N-H82]EDR06094.1 predicted protein [Laccaria bicolor S238N-H82]|eukprot:XP_001883382.1 predicted protein [Laccaria bicolor S238N-H82]
MSNLLQSIPEGRIDFAGQKLVDTISKIVLITAVVISFIAGFALQDIRVTFGLFGASTALLSLVVLPPWPMFNQHPVKWLDSKGNGKEKAS